MPWAHCLYYLSSLSIFRNVFLLSLAASKPSKQLRVNRTATLFTTAAMSATERTPVRKRPVGCVLVSR